MDTGFSYYTKKGFMGKWHPSNIHRKTTPIMDMFPQALIDGTNTYAEYGVSVIKLSDDKADKQVYIVAMDPGLQLSVHDLKTKEVFRRMKAKDIVIIMWPAALHPGCKYSPYLFNVESARQEWGVFFDEYADVVVEGGGSFKS